MLGQLPCIGDFRVAKAHERNFGWCSKLRWVTISYFINPTEGRSCSSRRPFGIAPKRARARLSDGAPLGYNSSSYKPKWGGGCRVKRLFDRSHDFAKKAGQSRSAAKR